MAITIDDARGDVTFQFRTYSVPVRAVGQRHSEGFVDVEGDGWHVVSVHLRSEGFSMDVVMCREVTD